MPLSIRLVAMAFSPILCSSLQLPELLNARSLVSARALSAAAAGSNANVGTSREVGSSTVNGVQTRSHVVTVPLDHDSPTCEETIEVFVREVYPQESEDR